MRFCGCPSWWLCVCCQEGRSQPGLTLTSQHHTNNNHSRPKSAWCWFTKQSKRKLLSPQNLTDLWKSTPQDGRGQQLVEARSLIAASHVDQSCCPTAWHFSPGDKWCIYLTTGLTARGSQCLLAAIQRGCEQHFHSHLEPKSIWGNWAWRCKAGYDCLCYCTAC